MSKKLYSKTFSQGVFETYSDRPSIPLVQVHQVHSADIVEYQGQDLDQVKADGIILDPKKYPRTVPAIKTADCLPVLYIGEKIGLVHAGWKGLSEGILTHPLLQKLKPANILIGPSIHHYEVSEDFKRNFPHSRSFYTVENQLYFDLQDHAMHELEIIFKNCEILISGACTFTNNEYNSYRRDKTEKRNWNIFKLNRG